MVIIVQTGYTRSELDKYSCDWKSSDISPNSKDYLDILHDGITWNDIQGAKKHGINTVRLGIMDNNIKGRYNYMIKFPGVDRLILYQCVVGSHNYNLNDPDSDRDYKVFVCPAFDDLYYCNYYSTSSVGTDMDYTAHDIRKLAELLWKGNINFIETLFADEYQAAEIESWRLKGILEYREELARMNLSNLWDACQGMYQNKFKKLEKGTSGTMNLVNTYGYDTKQALHCYRCLDLLERYNANGFSSFKQAIWYEEGLERDFILKIKNGGFTLGEFTDMVGNKQKEVNRLREIYKIQTPDTDLRSWLDNQVRELIKKVITRA